MQTEMQTELNEDIVQEMAEQFMAEAAAAGLAYQLDWDRAVREARAALAEKANEKADAAVKSVEKRRLWNEYKAALVAAGVSAEAMPVLATSDPDTFYRLPELIAGGQIQFRKPETEVAVKAAITKLWLGIGLHAPSFNLLTFETMPKYGK